MDDLHVTIEPERIVTPTLILRSWSAGDAQGAWHLRPEARGHGVAGQIGHALAHQAFLAADVEEVFVAAPVQNAGSLAVAQRLGMTAVEDVTWIHDGVRLEVLRMGRADLHKIRPGVSLDRSYDPDGLNDW
ncbi:GNAT family N-acetyltransferase [Nonomuraea sp. NPDC049419]|uniref:GNAT family N-acetyltransferase n=1 Tax=Nonomuraea sp. NPDC049419 TaxID=3155772 RepID=UPI0034193BB1